MWHIKAVEKETGRVVIDEWHEEEEAAVCAAQNKGVRWDGTFDVTTEEEFDHID